MCWWDVKPYSISPVMWSCSLSQKHSNTVVVETTALSGFYMQLLLELRTVFKSL